MYATEMASSSAANRRLVQQQQQKRPRSEGLFVACKNGFFVPSSNAPLVVEEHSSASTFHQNQRNPHLQYRQTKSSMSSVMMTSNNGISVGHNESSSSPVTRQSFATDDVNCPPGSVVDIEDESATTATNCSVISVRNEHNSSSNRNIRQQNPATSVLSESLLRQLKDSFQICDHDQDGRITLQELGRLTRTLGYDPDDEELKNMLNRADTNGNGTIEFDEFVQLMINTFYGEEVSSATVVPNGQQDGDQHLRAMFEIFDQNKDGRITADELRRTMRTLGENLTKHELEDMMRTADANGDGIIDFHEFKTMFKVPLQ